MQLHSGESRPKDCIWNAMSLIFLGVYLGAKINLSTRGGKKTNPFKRKYEKTLPNFLSNTIFFFIRLLLKYHTYQFGQRTYTFLHVQFALCALRLEVLSTYGEFDNKFILKTIVNNTLITITRCQCHQHILSSCYA